MKLSRNFYTRQDPVMVARDLLGKILVTRKGRVVTSGMIVETEAYGTDKASHAYGNRRTARTESMFLEGGHAYVYLCYGMYNLFNVVTGPKDTAAAVLIRGVEPVDGVGVMLRRRKMRSLSPKLSSGPGILTVALGIGREHDREDLCGDKIWVEDRGIAVRARGILCSERVGVNYAGEDARLPWRFRIRDSLWTSPAK